MLKLSLKQLQLLESTLDLAIQDELNHLDIQHENIQELNEIHNKVIQYLNYEQEKLQAKTWAAGVAHV